MANQMVFKRYELKYLLDQRQKEEILRAMEPHMALDRYGRTTIRNVYFDTDSYRLIRRSIEKPAYKEKLRVRSYKEAGPGDPVFVELKKKYKSVVYKRRILLPRELAMDCLEGRTGFPDSQLGAEIAYFCAFYGTLHPVVFLSYEREAFYDREGSDFRVTFDKTSSTGTGSFPWGPASAAGPCWSGAAPSWRSRPPGGSPCGWPGSFRSSRPTRPPSPSTARPIRRCSETR